MASNTNTGISLGTVLFIVFLILKLCGTITWSWWWVTAPLWIPLGLTLILIALVAMIFPEGFRTWWRKL
jgi:hypothetical protein